MWLLGSNITPVKFKHPLRGKYRALESGEIRKLLPALRSWDEATKNAIIEGSMEYALDIAGQYLAVLKSKRYIDDIVAAALLGVVEAVSRLQRDPGIDDKNPVAYICGGIHGAVSREVESDKFISARNSTMIKHKVPRRITSAQAIEVIFETVADKSTLTNDVEHFLEGLAENELEEQILEYRRDGYKDREIAKLMEVSDATVRVIRQTLYDRFMDAAGSKYNAKSKSSTRIGSD